MCCSFGKCLLCVPVESGCRVCAVIIVVGTGLTLLISFILGALTSAGVIFSSYYGDHYRVSGGIAVAMFMLALASAIGCVFALALYYGITKRRPGLVKAYFIYGMVATSLAVLTSMVLLLCSGNPIVMLLFLACVLYGLFLVLVEQTYFSLLAGVAGDGGAVFKDHSHAALVEVQG